MEQKKKRRYGGQSSLFSRREKVAAFLSLVVGIYVSVALWQHGINIYHPRELKTKLTRVAAPLTFDIKSKDGKTVVHGWVTDRAYSGNVTLFPAAGCNEFLAIGVKNAKGEELFELAPKLERLGGGVSVVHSYPNLLTVNRPCMDGGRSLWTWEEVWKSILPLLPKE